MWARCALRVAVLGSRLRELRKVPGRTLDDLAEEIGLTKGYLSKLETGRQTQHDGEEMVFVLSGTVEFQVGEDIYELSPGDCIYFNARRRHRGRGKYGEAKAIVVTYEPQDTGKF